MFSSPSFDELGQGFYALVFLDDSNLSKDFWALDRLLSSKSVKVFFVEATTENAEKYQFSKFPQVRLYKDGNEVLAVTGSFDEVVEGCLSCLRR
jgi:hypothetical protein